MRVIAGSRRSLVLVSPKGDNTRPTQDRTKETLFNVLLPDLCGGDFLDLYSGSGAIAIEALSRGESGAVLVENNRDAVECIKKNLKTTDFTDRAVLMECNVTDALKRLAGHKPFDVVFMDPPYHAGYERGVFELLRDADYVDEYTVIVCEALKDTDMSFLPELGFRVYKTKEYKTNCHIFAVRA